MALLLLMAQASPESIQQKMKATTLSLELDNAPLEDFVRVAGESIGHTIVISPSVWKAYSAEALRVTLALDDVRVSSALRTTLRPRGLTVTIRDGVLTVIPLAEAGGKVTTRTYDISNIERKIQNFTWSNPRWGMYAQLVDENSRMQPREDTENDIWGYNDHPTGNMFEPRSHMMFISKAIEDPTEGAKKPHQQLQELVETHTGGDSWTENPAVAIGFTQGKMLVSQTAEAHAQVRKFLDTLEAIK